MKISKIFFMIFVCSLTCSSVGSAMTTAKLDELAESVEKGKKFDEAIKAAQDGMKSSEEAVCDHALWLWRALFKKNRGFAEAINTAKEGLLSSDSHLVFYYAFYFSKELVERNLVFPEAVKAVKYGIQSPEVDIQLVSIDLCKALVEKGYGLKELTETFNQLPESQASDYRVVEFKNKLPSLLLNHNITQLKIQLIELKNKLGGLSQKLNSLQGKLATGAKA